MSKKIGLVLALDGEKTFTAGLKAAAASAKEMGQELKNVSEEYKGSANSLEALKAKQTALRGVQDALNRTMEAAKAGLTKANDNYRKITEALESYEKKLAGAKEAQERMKASGQTQTDEYKKQAKEIDQLESDIESLYIARSKEDASISKWNTELSKSRRELKNCDGEIQKNEKYLMEAENATDKCATSIDKMGNEVKETADEMERATDSAGGFFDVFSGTVAANVLSNVFGTVVDHAKQAIEYTLEVGMAFEKSMSQVEAISGASGDDLDRLSAKAQQLGSSTQFSASQAADALGYMALAGWDTEQMLSGIGPVLDLAAASGMDLAKTSDIVTDYITAFGLKASDAAHFSDVMAYAMAHSNTNVEQLGEAYKNVAATAGSMGYSLEDTTAALMLMANAGVKGGEAGTTLNAIMTRLATDTKDCATELKKYGVEVYDNNGQMNDLATILDQTAAAFNGLTDEEAANLSKMIAGTSQYSGFQTLMSGIASAAGTASTSISDVDDAVSVGLNVQPIVDEIGKLSEVSTTTGTDVNSVATALNAIGTFSSADAETTASTLSAMMSTIASNTGGAKDALESVGAALVYTDDGSVNLSATLATLATKWSTLSDEQKEAVGTALVGSGNYTTLQGIMDEVSTATAGAANGYDGFVSALNKEVDVETVKKVYGDLEKAATDCNLSMDGVTAAFALLTQPEETDTDTAASALIGIMEGLTSGTENAKEALNQFGAEVDSQGNITNFAEVIGNMADSWDDMSEAEQDALAQLAGTENVDDFKDAISNLSRATATGGGNFTSYKNKLSNVDGAAKDMAATVNNNLSGALTTLGSAVEGLGIAAYNYINGPAAYVLSAVTTWVTALTKLIDPVKSTFDSFLEGVEKGDEHVNSLLENAQDQITGGEEKAEMISAYKDELLELYKAEEQSIEGDKLNEYEKYQLKAAVDALRESVPELAEAYDEETGSLNLSREALKSLLEEEEKAAIQSAIRKAKQTELDAYAEAVVNRAKAQTAYRKALDELNAQISEAGYDVEIKSYEDYVDLIGKASDTTNEWSAHYSALLRDMHEGANTGLIGAFNTFLYANQVFSETDSTLTTARTNLKEVNEALDGFSDTASDTAKAEDELADGAEDVAKANEQIKKSAEDVEKSMDTQKSAMQQLYEAYSTFRGKLEQDIQNKLSIFDAFDGGTDMTTEDIEKNMMESVKALQAWKDNLAVVSQYVGEEGGISQEFYDYILSLGADGANLVKHMADTVTKQGDNYAKTQFKHLSDMFSEQMDLTDEIATAYAKDKTALELFFDELGSTDVEWTGLKDAIAGAKEALTDTTGWGSFENGDLEQSIDDAIALCKTMGVKIPEGLADGIKSGKVGVEEAYAALTGAMSGQVEYAKTLAAEMGISIPDEIASGLEGNTEDVAEAYENLVALLVEKKTSAEEAATEAASASTTAYTAAISSGSEDVDSAAEGLADAATGALDDSDGAKTAGEAMVTGVVGALNSGQDSMKKAGQNLVNAALQGASVNLTYNWYRIGYMIDLGLSGGVSSNSYLVSNAVSTMVNDALTAAKTAAEIKSPSRKFKREVGNMLPAGVAVGIDEKSYLASDAAEKMSNSILNQATKWIKNYKKNKLVTLDDEEWYWKQIADRVKYGSAAYTRAMEKVSGVQSKRLIQQSGVTNDFGVSRYDDKGNAKEAEKYYSDVYSAAKKYLDNYKVLKDVTLDAELDYWKQVKKHLKTGTDAWYDAQKQINDIKDDIKDRNADVLKQMIANTEKAVGKLDIRSSQNVNKEVDNAIKKLQAWKDVQSDLARNKKKDSDEYATATKNIIAAYGEIVSAASDYVSRQKSLHGMSAQEEMEYWKNIKKELKSGTDAYNDVLIKIKDLKIKSVEEMASMNEVNNFFDPDDIVANAISVTNAWKKNTNLYEEGTAELIGVEKNLISSYNGIISAMSQYIANKKVHDDVTLQDERDLWTGLLSTVTNGSQAYIDILAKIEEIDSDIARERVETSNNLLANYKVYHKVSEKGEMEYWDRVRKWFQAGTQERIDADEKYIEAKEAYYDSLRELDDDYKEDSKRINDELVATVENLQKAYDDAVASRKSDILSSFDMFSAWDATGYDADTILYNMRTQVAGITLWEQQLEELKRKGIAEEMYEYLSGLGPSAAANIYSLNQMTQEQLREYEQMYETINKLAESQAVKDNANLYDQTNQDITNARTEAQKELDALYSDYRTNLKELNGGMSSELGKLADTAAEEASKAVAGIVNTFDNKKIEVYNSAKDLVTMVDGGLSGLPAAGATVGKETLDSILGNLADHDKIQSAVESMVNSVKTAMIDAGLYNIDMDNISDSGIRQLNSISASQQGPATVNINNDTSNALLTSMVSNMANIVAMMQAGLQLDDGTILARYQKMFSQESASSIIRLNGGLL